MVEPAEAVVRLVIVFLLAFGIGLERQLRRKPVGLGTFIFVSTGACALAILSVDLEDQNPLPLLGGVITGIGFLGAGALIRSNDRVFGFTTAALVWAMAALGVAAGAGLYYLAFVNYGIVWAVVLTDRYLESKWFGSHAKVVHLTVANPIRVEELDADRVRDRQMDDLRMGPEPFALQIPVREHDGPHDSVVHEGEVVQARPGGHAQGRHRPDEGRGREAEDPVVRTDQRARAEESDSGDHAPEERERILVLQIDGKDRQGAGAGRDEHERTEPDRLPPELPFESDPER